MFVFVVWQINCPSLWVRRLTSVRCLTMKITIRRLKYVRSKSTIRSLKLMSKVHNRKSDVRSRTKSEVWCPTSVRKLSEVWSTTYVCSKPGVQKPNSKVKSMSKIRVWNQSLKSVSCLSLKPKSRVYTAKIRSLKSKAYLKSVQSFLKLL